MKALELLKNQEKLLVVDAIQNKKMKTLATNVNELIVEMNSQINKVENFVESEKNGEQGNKIIVAKSLCNFFKDNKFLKVEQAVEQLANEEKAIINQYYNTKNKLLDTIRMIMKESSKEAVISAFDIFSGDFTKCQPEHEVVILKDRNVNILDTFIQELDCELVVNGAFDTLEGQEVDYNPEVLNRNIELCNRKNNEIYGGKPGKQAKINTLIEKLNEIGQKTVAFFTYKNALLDIGCNPKGVKDYENDLAKQYIPIKKALQKEFKIELEDICNVVVNEAEYGEVDIEQPIEEQMAQFEETSYNDDSQSNIESPSFETPTPQFYSEEQPTQTNPFEDLNSQNTFENNYVSNNSQNFESQSSYSPEFNTNESQSTSFASVEDNTKTSNFDSFLSSSNEQPFNQTQDFNTFENNQTQEFNSSFNYSQPQEFNTNNDYEQNQEYNSNPEDFSSNNTSAFDFSSNSTEPQQYQEESQPTNNELNDEPPVHRSPLESFFSNNSNNNQNPFDN
ncbi:MAG: hypothetical protein IJW59_04760 [Clostridia bacterium]|nr:hypothetical protein [Clostridia bacterium]